MDPSVCQPRKAVKLNYSLMWIVWVAPVQPIIFQSNATFDEKLQYHYNDVIIGAIAPQITSLTIVYSAVDSDADQRKHQSSASLGTGEFPAQMASNAENFSFWWRHHVLDWRVQHFVVIGRICYEQERYKISQSQIADCVKGSKFIFRCFRPIRMKIYSSLHYLGINVLTSQIICMKSDTV